VNGEKIIKKFLKHLVIKVKYLLVLCTVLILGSVLEAQNLGVELQQTESDKHKEGIYQIQHINTYHNKLKK
jgi:hypothetical protein